MMPVEDLRAHLHYEPSTGEFRWKILSGSRRAGVRADRSSKRGYRRINFRGKDLSAHRVAFAIMTGEWPTLFIDHRNGVKSDNRWGNLRQATPTQNNANAPGRGELAKGVTRRGWGKYQAQIKVSGRNIYLGVFEDEAAAAEAYARAAKQHYGEFARSA